MGLLSRYRRFDDVPADEVYRDLRSRRRHERAHGREQVMELDLSRTSAPTLPNTEVVNAAISVARLCLNADPDPRAIETRTAIAEHHGIGLEQVAIGNGAAELIKAAARALLERDDELVTSWPSYPLYTGLARHSRARTVTVPLNEGEHDLRALREAVTPRTRVITLCNPNDPTGTHLTSERLAAFLEQVPEHVHVLVDEALAHFQIVEPVDAALTLIERFPNLLVFRSFSKIYGLSGLRAGYAVGAPTESELLDALSPVLGVSAVTQAAMTHALKRGGEDVRRRRDAIAGERQRLLEGLERLPFSAAPSQANFVWLRAGDVSGSEITRMLARSGIRVQAADAVFGEPDHVRVAVRDAESTDRLLAALASASGAGP